jgi:hypothetical protein
VLRASAIPPDGDRAVGSQAMRYGAAIMALCWPVTSSAVTFAVDSLLEGAVTSELVSEAPEIPC